MRSVQRGPSRVSGPTRRAVVAVLPAVVTLASGGRGTAADRNRRLGVLMSLSEDEAEPRAWLAAFRQSLQQLGWQDGGNLEIEIRWASGDANKMREHAAALASTSLDVVLTNGTPASKAMHAAAAEIPMVFVNVADPVRTGLVPSLARPGGQITGFTNFEHDTAAKWVELLREIVPRLSQALVIVNPGNDAAPGFIQSLEAAAQRMQVALIIAKAKNAQEIQGAISSFPESPYSGLIVLPDFTTSLHHSLIAHLAFERRLPAVYPFRFHVASGGLLAYAVDTRDVYRRAAFYADRILKGTKPGDLPIQQPTLFQLIVNLATARALGLTIPPTLLARADEVIE